VSGKKFIVWVLCAIAIAQATACVSSRDQAVDIAGADLTGTGPGSLIEAKTIPRLDDAIPRNAIAGRVVYRSTSGIDGSATVVSGAIFIPPGHPPEGGWPVIAFAHGTTGVSNDCAPSLSHDLFGNAKLFAGLLSTGVAVAAADYQGLGTPGAHPYLDAKTAGLNVIDSVRAIRFVSHDVSVKWAAFGGSQGGAAAWAANEMATTYATDLKVVGSISLVPAADMSGYVALAADGRLSDDQRAAYIWILMGLERTRPQFPIDDYRRGLAKEKWDVLSVCKGPKANERAKALAEMPPSDLTPASPEAQQRLYDLLKSMALPLQRAAAPMLIFYGGKDTFIDPRWTKDAIERACKLGDTIQSVFQADKGHGDIDPGDKYLQWLGERFGGQPAQEGCSS
jgi:alpha-beta hydrolase superfamily lysophospholipase